MRSGSYALIGSFVAFLLTGAVLTVFMGGNETRSEAENRALAPIPEWSVASLWSGRYFRGWDNYAADHVGFRGALVAASRAIASWQGLAGPGEATIVASRANNAAERQAAPPAPDVGEPLPQADAGAPSPTAAPSAAPAATPSAAPAASAEPASRVAGKVLIAGDSAMNVFAHAPAAGQLYADTINRFRQAAAARFGDSLATSVLIAPTAAEFVPSESLRSLSDSQEAAIRTVYDRLDRGVSTIDAVTALRGHAADDVYFRTDHHWTATGAYYAYAAYALSRGMQPVPLERYETERVTGFLGSLYQATLNGRLAKRPDTIVLYKPFVKHEYVVYYQGPLKMDLLDMNHAARNNKYRIFLSGDRPWAHIATESDAGRRLLVVKDSYGNAFVPFLLPHYKDIYVIDPRQFDKRLLDFIAERHIDEVLFVNNAEVAMYTGFTETIAKLLD